MGAKAFVRQRRNLLIVSVSLAATILMELRLETPVSFFGNTISIGNPNAIGVLLWALWLYFLVRYLAFHAQYQPTSEDVSAFFLGQRQKYVGYTARKAIETAHPEIVERKTNVSFQGFKKRSATQYSATVTISAMPNAPEQTVEIDLKLFPVWLAGCKALLRAGFTYAPTTEYILPYVVAVVPLILYFSKSF